MSILSQSEAAQARATAHEVVQRLQNEPAYREQLKASPMETLTAAGMPKEVAPAFLRDIGAESDVTGYQMADTQWPDSGCSNGIGGTSYWSDCIPTNPLSILE